MPLTQRTVNILSGGLGSDLWINGGLDEKKLNVTDIVKYLCT